MNGLDLRIAPPRSPEETLDGLVFMPRTIDKLRATLPGGHLGSYHLFPGLSQTLLEFLGIDLWGLQTAVARAQADADVAVWIRTRSDVRRFSDVNDVLSAFRIDDIPREHRIHFDSLYPEYLRARYPRLFDLLKADDAELYPALDRK